MKEFIEKLIGRLEELKDDVVDDKCPVEKNSRECEMEYACETCYLTKAINIVNELAEEYRNDKVCQTAIMYAKNLHKYGIQIDSIWETATQQSMALNQAYMRGRQDERDIFDEWQEKHINTSTDTSSGWIPCSERLPEANQKVLTCDKDGWISVNVNMPYIGVRNDFECGYYVAWQPLPQPYKENENGKI